MVRRAGQMLVLCLFAMAESVVAERKNYGMYVWTWGFDSTVPECDEREFSKWSTTDRRCFTHTWDTEERREWLWRTCNRPGREIGTIFISDTYRKLKSAFDAKDCNGKDVTLIKRMLSEGHTRVPGLQIYALFAASDVDVSERFYIKFVVWFNDNCSGNLGKNKFDGVAVNNEALPKYGTDSEKQAYLDKLNEIKMEAENQATGKLQTHYSIGWHWGISQDGKSDNSVAWNGKYQRVTRHMIDIFDHVDVQVAYTRFPQIADRLFTADLNYSREKGKKMFSTFYTEKGDILCQTTFFPQPCPWGEKTEDAMFRIFDEFNDHGIGDVIPTIHYFRGIYSSGGHSDWPNHGKNTSDVGTVTTSMPPTTVSNTVTSCGPGSYCKCWQNPPVCQGTDAPCTCADD